MAVTAIDNELAAYAQEIEERQQFIDQTLVEAREKGQDLSEEQLESIRHHRDKIKKLNERSEPLMETRKISATSQERLAGIAQIIASTPRPNAPVEYRTAGGYIIDTWRAGLGNEEARRNLSEFNRAASHQTTADNPGLMPTPILGPVINFIDDARPLVGQLGPRQLPSASWSRPKVTQHTAIAAQSAEKAELTSQKMIIGKLAVTPTTLGGYVNVSRQDVDWSQPQVMDIVINDLASQYAIQTEKAAVQAFYAGGTTGPTIPATPSANDVAAALWVAAGSIYTATKGQGRLVAACSPDVLGIIGPLFSPVNPTNAQSSGFTAADFGQGVMGNVAGITVVVTSGFAAAKSLMVLSTAAAEVYEERVGALQVVEPSVLGVQIAYAGYFASLIVEATGIIKVTVT